MDQETKQGAQEVGGTGGASSAGSSQSAQADLSAVADRAKAAAQGFQFAKIFEGRIDNKNFFFYAVASFVISMVLGMIPVIGWILSLALAVLGIGVMIRRFHDISVTGWATLIVLVPFINLLAVVYLCWKHGDTAKNAYGEPADSKREFFRAVLNT